MNKLMISLTAVLSIATVAGCKKKGGGAAAEYLSKMEGFSKSMCDCKDKACADKVNDEMTKWGLEMAKNAKPGDTSEKPDPDMAKKSADVMTKYTECMTKMMMAGAGGDMKGSGEGSAKTAPPPDKGSAAMTPPATKTKEHKAPDWLAKIPAQAPTVKVGQMAWVLRGTVFDGGEYGRVDVDEVTAVDKNTVTTRPTQRMAQGADAWKHKPNPQEDNLFTGLPALMAIPARTVDDVKPKVGDIVWAYLGNTTTPVLAHVKAVDGGVVTIDTVTAMGDKLEENKTDVIEPYGKGVAPFTMVAYKDGTDMKVMTVLAISGDKVYGYEYGGKAVEQKKSAVKPLTPVFKDRKAGDKIWSFSGNSGKPGEIKEVVIPKEVFKIEFSATPWFAIFDKAP